MKRFVVLWIPTDKVEALCDKRGRKPDDNSGLWDWVEPDECEELAGTFTEFRDAIAKAKRLAKGDVWHAPTIYEQEQRSDNYGRAHKWCNVAHWHVHDWVSRHSDPDYIYV
jgi:hypothetical protein